MKMIPFYLIHTDTNPFTDTPESILARTMGTPPWETQSVSGNLPASAWAKAQNVSVIGMIFDPHFFYSPHCWEQWVNAVLTEGTDGKINVPLGNQHPAWREGLEIPLYLTLSGVERAAEFKGPCRWMIRNDTGPDNYCAVIVPVSVMDNLPEDLLLSELPKYWSEKSFAYRIFCEGWLHVFSALREAGCRHDLLAMCEWKGMVLELGCDRGLMAKTCREQEASVCWIGMDINKEALSFASSYTDMAVCADIEHLPLSSTCRFDRIVCGDVLEHLAYPWHLLSHLRQWIKEDGLLIASFPNAGHWAIVEDLLSGRWDETPSGILCVSHLRFGTKKTWERWFAQSGWEVIRWESEKVPLSAASPLNRILSEQQYDLHSLETVRYRIIAKIAD